MVTYDIVIIGGGPAGLTAGLYTSRALMKTLLLEKIAPGGLVITTEKIENYPGFSDGISGYELMQQMEKQATKFGLEILSEEVIMINEEDNVFNIKTTTQDYKALSIIIATGTTYRKLGVEGEDLFSGHGISNCATCDGPLFKDKEIIVVGGGDAAVEEALFLTRFVKKVYLIHRRDRLRASAILQEHAKTNQKIEFVWNSIVSRIHGKNLPAPSRTDGVGNGKGQAGKIEKVTIRNLIDNKERDLNIEGIFVFIGFEPNTTFLQGFIELDENGYIITDTEMKTSRNGIFAAGDVRSHTLRQIISACGDGARAAVSAQHFVEHLKGIFYPSAGLGLS